MANTESILKAKALGLALKTITGFEPEYSSAENYVRVYYSPGTLPFVQDRFNALTKQSSVPSDIRFEWFPIIKPTALKMIIPVAAGLFALGFVIGRLSNVK